MTQSSLERAGLYRLFAAALRYPAEKDWRAVLDGLDPARGALEALGASVVDFDELAVALRAMPRDELEPIYIRTFVNALPSIVAAPYESLHVPGERRLAVLAAVADVYERCGVHLVEGVDGRGADMPDHIATELELMQYLCVEEHAWPEHASVIAATALEFLDVHLAPFVHALVAEVPDGIYHHALRALESFVDAER